jgi:hypothetical protein
MDKIHKTYDYECNIYIRNKDILMSRFGKFRGKMLQFFSGDSRF